MRKHNHFHFRINRLAHTFMACCIVLLLACSGRAQQKQANLIDWKIDYKGQLSKEEKAQLYSNITNYAKDQLVAQKRPDLAKNLQLTFTESANSIRVIYNDPAGKATKNAVSGKVINDGSTVATGSIVIGPPPPRPPIIPPDISKKVNIKISSAAMH